MEKLLKRAGLENCNSLNTPGVKELTHAASTTWFESEDLQGKAPSEFTDGRQAVGGSGGSCLVDSGDEEVSFCSCPVQLSSSR